MRPLAPETTIFMIVRLRRDGDAPAIERQGMTTGTEVTTVFGRYSNRAFNCSAD